MVALGWQGLYLAADGWRLLFRQRGEASVSCVWARANSR